MEQFKELLKWQYIIPCILFIFSTYAWYLSTNEWRLNTNNKIVEMNNKQEQTTHELNELKSQVNSQFTRYDVDMAVVKQDNSYIKNTQDVIIRKLDDYTYKKNN